jgi:hypothetical protein
VIPVPAAHTPMKILLFIRGRIASETGVSMPPKSATTLP